MASAAIYDAAVAAWARGDIAWERDDIRALLVSEEYEPSQSDDAVRADLGSAEVPNSGSYRTGGQKLSKCIVTHDPMRHIDRLSAGPMRWSAFTGHFRYLIIHDATNDVLVAQSDLGAQMATNATVELDYPAGICEFVNQPQIAEIGAA